MEAAGEGEGMDPADSAAELLDKLDQLNRLLKERKEKGFPDDEKLEGAVEKLHAMLGLTDLAGGAPSLSDSLPIGDAMLKYLGWIGICCLFGAFILALYFVTRPAPAKKEKKKK